MRKLIPVLLVIALAACGKKEWSKSYLYNECMKSIGKNKQVTQVFSEEKLKKICDCSAEKAFAKYKSQAEANKDESGAQQIGAECALEALGK